MTRKRAAKLMPSERKAQILEAVVKFFAEEGFDASKHNFTKKIGVIQPLI
jgi:hypothetical protein